MSPSERVAVTTPDVAAERVLAWDVLAVPLLMVTASLPRLLIPDPLYVLTTADADPVTVSMLAALMVPDVWPFSVLRMLAMRLVSESVMASLPRLLMPEEA